MSTKTTAFVGFSFSTLDMSDALEQVLCREPDMPFAYVVTPNVDHVVRYHESNDDERKLLEKAYDKALLCLCDSRVLARLALVRGRRLTVVTGSDLTARLLTSIELSKGRVCLVGGDTGTVEALSSRFPSLDLVQHQPPMGLRKNSAAMLEAAVFVERSRARYVLLAVGSPQQELLAALIESRGRATGTGLCIGASVDFLTGRAVRAPRLMQRSGFEWLHRLVTNQGRLWRRYLVDGPKIFRIVAQDKSSFTR